MSEFFRSKAGKNFALFSMLCALMSGGIGAGSYVINLEWFQQDKGAEKITAVQLVDAFVANYAGVRDLSNAANAPVPASFRAHAIESFNKMRNGDDALRLLMVGPPGREIATAPADQEMAQTIERFMRTPNPQPVTRFVSPNGSLVFRTTYPSIASHQSCVDCHNRLQPDRQPQWRLNDVVGAFVIDVPAEQFLHRNLLLSSGIGGVIFLISSGIALFIFALQFREFQRREASERSLQAAASEINALNRELERRVEARTMELRGVQGELLRKERLAALGQLTATVSHELRNPLGVIRNSMFTLTQAIVAEKPALQRVAARIDRSITRCDAIISELLDYTRVKELNRAVVDFDAWLGEFLDEHQLPDGITLKRDLRAQGTAAWIDPMRLRRVFINLLDNAADAIKGSEAVLPEWSISVRTATVADRLVVTLEDTGPGMTPEVLAKVFEPLFSTKGFGVGLGLPIVKQIVEQHGGVIDIDSARNRGTRITISLPLTASMEEAAQ